MPLNITYFPLLSQRWSLKPMARWTPFLYLPELASVVELGCAKEVCLLPRFLPLYKLFTTDLATWGFLSAAVEIRLLDFVFQIYRVFFPPVTSSCRTPSRVNLIRAGESELRQSPEPPSLPIRFLVHCFRRSISTSN